MKVELKPGKYVVAVSGGVDSVVLLALIAKLAKSPELRVQSQKALRSSLSALRTTNSFEFVVAHFDHGIRTDSALDCKFVQKLAAKYNLPFTFEEGKLGPSASEAKARDARYKFLTKVLIDNNAKAIVTAHHQDDLIETAILNILRGTSRRGITSLKSRKGLIRPMLDVTKKQIKNYAAKNNLKWREDPTNSDTAFLRNYIRANIVPKISAKNREVLMRKIQNLSKINPEIDKLLKEDFDLQTKKGINRKQFLALPYQISLEVMAAFLRQNEVDVDTKTLNRLSIAAKTLMPGKTVDINSKVTLKIKERTIEV